jgi:hypothetical protein
LEKSITHFEKCLLVRHQTLELLACIAKQQRCINTRHLGHKIEVLCDELEYAWKTACLNELLIVHEKAKHLSRLVVTDGAS